MLPNASACSICQDHEHVTKKCPELTKEINQTGFYKPAGGMPQGGDDDDEHASIMRNLQRQLLLISGSCGWNCPEKKIYV